MNSTVACAGMSIAENPRALAEPMENNANGRYLLGLAKAAGPKRGA